MTHTVAIETGIVDAYGVLPEIPGSIEIVARLYMEELKYSLGGSAACIEEYPVIDEVTFEVAHGVGNPETNKAFARYLQTLYGADRKFQARIDSIILEDLEESWKN